VYQALLARSKNETLGKKDTRIVADQFGVHIRLVQRLWKRGKNQLANNIPVVVASRKKGRCGRKAVSFDLEQLHNIPLKQRMTIEDVCSKLNMNKSRIKRYLKKDFLRCHSSSIKPYLTDANKKTQLKCCVDMIEQGLRIFLTLCSLMKNGSTSLKNLRNITCYPRKMNHIALVRTRMTSLCSCFCVFVLDQGLGMESVFLWENWLFSTCHL
jgi:predicted transcriptional regulator